MINIEGLIKHLQLEDYKLIREDKNYFGEDSWRRSYKKDGDKAKIEVDKINDRYEVHLFISETTKEDVYLYLQSRMEVMFDAEGNYTHHNIIYSKYIVEEHYNTYEALIKDMYREGFIL